MTNTKVARAPVGDQAADGPGQRRTVQQEIAELHALDDAALAARFTAIFDRRPRSRHRGWLLRRCAHQLQVARCGGLSETARRRLAELMSEIELPAAAPPPRTTGVLPRGDGRHVPTIGTSYEREWRGRVVRVTVVDGGFEADAIVYASLSAAVRAITGAKWNPSIFFGLKPRGAKA